MRDPYQLRVTRSAEDLAVLTYEVTRRFPRDERFGLIAQMRKAAVSIGSNICEGCGRGGERAFIPFLHHGIRSAGELEFQTRLSKRLGFGVEADLDCLFDQTKSVERQLARLIVTLQRRL
jgi:four helix bundle protein